MGKQRFDLRSFALQVDKLKMTEMWSQQGEKVAFDRPVEAKGKQH